MGAKKNHKEDVCRKPNYVVALYDHIPTESNIFNEDEPDFIIPDATVQLAMSKGEIFEVIGDLDWWLYVKCQTFGELGYVPSISTVPVNENQLTPHDRKVLSHGGNVPSYALDVEVDLRYFPDALAKKDNLLRNREVCPEENANIFSRMTLWWLTRLIVKGYRRSLTDSDLWTLSDYNSSKEIVPRFKEAWAKEEERLASLKKSTGTKSRHRENDGEYEGIQNDDVVIVTKDTAKKEPRPSLMKVLAGVFRRLFLLSFVFKIIQDIALFCQPQLLNYTYNPGQNSLGHQLQILKNSDVSQQFCPELCENGELKIIDEKAV